MKNYNITYSFSQNYNTCSIFNILKNEKTADYIRQLEIIDSIVQNQKEYNIALSLIEKCKKI